MGEREQDRRRLRTSLFISLAFWAVLMPLLSFLKFQGPPPPPESMNPLFVELAPSEEPPPSRSPSSTAAPAEADRAGAEAPRAASASGGASAAPTSRAAASGGEAAATPALRADPSAAPAAASGRTKSASPYQGGADPFAPLSEESLKGEELPAPVPKAAPAARAESPRSKSSARPADSFDQALRETSERLAGGGAGGSGGAGRAEGPGSSSNTPSPSGTGSGTGAGPGLGNMSGDFDFGGGATRQLYSSRRIKVSDRLLQDQPSDLSFKVSFIVERGGAVLPNTIRFDPPVPRADLEAYLRAAFSSWTFSFADSDGQVVFRYSIKVQ